MIDNNAVLFWTFNYMPSKSPLRVYYITPGGLSARGGMGSVARCLIAQFEKQSEPLQITILDTYGRGSFALMPFYFVTACVRLFADAFSGRSMLCTYICRITAASSESFCWRTLLYSSVFRFCCTFMDRNSRFMPKVFLRSKRSKLIERLKSVSRIVVLGTHWKNYLVDRLGIPAANIKTIANGVDVPEFLPSRNASQKCRIIALGLMSQRKGTSELLEALATSAMNALSWDACVAGNGDVDFYRAEAKRLVCGPEEMPGWVAPSDAREKLLHSDVFVLPSHNEGLPMAILEAMAAGVAVVTTPVGAITDLVINEETGLLVPVGNAETLSIALARLVKDRDLCVQMAAKGRQRVVEQFNSALFAQKVAQQYRELYEDRSKHRHA